MGQRSMTGVHDVTVAHRAGYSAYFANETPVPVLDATVLSLLDADPRPGDTHNGAVSRAFDAGYTQAVGDDLAGHVDVSL
jgi:hypothetical protein